MITGSLIPSAYAVFAGAVVGHGLKSMSPELRNNLYNFGKVSLISVITAVSIENLIDTLLTYKESKTLILEKLDSKVIVEVKENRQNLITKEFIKLIVSPLSAAAISVALARTARISEETYYIVPTALAAVFVKSGARTIISHLIKEEEFPDEIAEKPKVPVDTYHMHHAAEIAAGAYHGDAAPAAAAVQAEVVPASQPGAEHASKLGDSK